MAIVMTMRWDGVTPEQYDATRALVHWEHDKPKGGLFHVASFADGALHVSDVWESAEDFDRFVTERLMPGVKQVGIAGEPQVQVRPAHAIYAPGYE